jgi:hypothetical protein
LLGLGFSLITVKRSALYKSWYMQGIFEQALHYGNNVEKMFNEEWPTEGISAPARTKKPRARAKARGSTTSKTRATKPKAT